ncbi:MAG: M23 family metallopeptidase [Rhizobiales bacterium]|nr:M23 family metallopeptidase [Hyphomicrobiales bacterium]
MSIVSSGKAPPLARRREPRRIIIARGEDVRSFTIRPWLAGSIALFAGIFGILYLAATAYLVFRDDLLAASITYQRRMQHAYEDRITSLRADIDRLTSKQLLNQEAFDEKMDRLLGRQAMLDARQDIIAQMSQAARQAGVVGAPAQAPAAAADPADDNDDNAPADDDVEGDSAPAKPLPFKTSDAKPVAGAMAPVAMAFLRPVGGEPPAPGNEEAKLGSVAASLDTLAEDQVSYVEDMAGRVAGRTDKIAAVLKTLGQPVPKSVTAGGVGGPFVPLDPDADPETFRATVSLITGELDRLSTVRRLAGRLPLTKPVQNAAITSRFGARIDPFFGRPAMHPGIDFAAYVGFPIHATAGGTVITAESTGGYGNMVEIDHGNGVTTRYGHMSKILVKAGQIIPKGAIVGLAGSTGRSTGPHVHYEVRIDGHAIDPIRYINAGRQLEPLL